jgi:hypothetical protein
MGRKGPGFQNILHVRLMGRQTARIFSTRNQWDAKGRTIRMFFMRDRWDARLSEYSLWATNGTPRLLAALSEYRQGS